MIEFWINKIVLSDSSSFSFSKNDIIVFVGPNNSGKSKALQNIYTQISDSSYQGQVITNIETSSSGTDDEVTEHIKQQSVVGTNGGSVSYQWMGGNSFQPINIIKNKWNRKTGGLNDLYTFFSRLLSTDERLHLARRVEHIDYGEMPSTHPLHLICDNEELANKLNDSFKKAFNTDLFMSQKPSKNVILRVGDKPILEAGENLVSDSYTAKIRALPAIDEQGDGMRAYAGIIIHSLASSYTILLIDEPEAFLHPPQARHLGRTLAESIAQSRQLFISTHSGDVLRGLLDSNKDNIHVIRLSRGNGGNINQGHLLDKSQIKEIWNAPILRYSNVLDGIFHERVIICESDADCRFYSAVMDWIFESDGNSKRPDIMFIHSGGVGGIDKIMRSLQALSVPVSIVVDFDALNKSEIKTLSDNLNISWNNAVVHLDKIRNIISNIPPCSPETTKVKFDIDNILTTETGQFVSPRGVEKIREVVKSKSGWSSAKKIGRDIFHPTFTTQVKADEGSDALSSLLALYNTSGLFVVEIGELESFCRIDNLKSGEWLEKIFEDNSLRNRAFDSARSFVEKILGIA